MERLFEGTGGGERCGGEQRAACTANIAFLTRSLVMRPFLARLVMRAALVLPPECQAIVWRNADREDSVMVWLR